MSDKVRCECCEQVLPVGTRAHRDRETGVIIADITAATTGGERLKEAAKMLRDEFRMTPECGDPSCRACPTPVEAAIDVVAQQVIAALVDRYVGEEWGNFPEIGEHDWERVTARCVVLAGFPDSGEYDAAYALLESRATPLS